MPLRVDLGDLNSLRAPTDDFLSRMTQDRAVSRLWARDHTLWRPDADEIANRLGWLDSAATMPASLAEIAAQASAVRRDGLTHALLLGMGGSSLAPEVFRKVFGVAPGHLDLAVLDSTVPEAVLAAAEASTPEHTLYVPATKSGGTVETLSFLKFFYRRAVASLGSRAGDHFIAITDPGSGLADLARSLDFRHTFLNDPDIGGRYSALSMFGLVPAALVGVDVDGLLQRARAAAAECSVEGDNPSTRLAAALAAGAAAGRDKLTLVMPPSIAALGAWVEQLIAESTGKDGRGILPVDGEPLMDPAAYGPDRLFVYVRGPGSNGLDEPVAALAAAGHPVVRQEMPDRRDLGAHFLLWEIATALTGYAMGIQPFDQPNVESAKALARAMTEAYRRDGTLPETEADLVEGPVSAFGAPGATSLADALAGLLGEAAPDGPRSYVSVQAYLPPTDQVSAHLAGLRARLAGPGRLAVTAGYGPRFLHSTGQLHKGDGGNGRFLQLTADAPRDADIPDEATADTSSMSFAVLAAAQAQGDGLALAEAGRRVLRLHMSGDLAEGLGHVSRALDAALSR